MSFTLEEIKNGRPNILFKNNKYREGYSLKSGEVIWRCLGRSCGATIRTDVKKTSIIVTNGKHSGPHPVTMRSLSSPSGQRTSAAASPGTSARPATTFNSHVLASAPASSTPAATTPSAALDMSTPAAATSTPGPEPMHPLTACSPDTDTTTSARNANDSSLCAQELVTENAMLKEEITQLSQQVKILLDHSISSDTRLLEYTNEVFIANGTKHTSTPSDPRSMVESAVQCELAVPCRNQRCAEDKALIESLRTTIEVLEADIKCLRAETKTCECRSTDADWSVCENKRRQPFKTKNRFESLSSINTEDEGLIPQNTKNINKKAIQKYNQSKNQRLHKKDVKHLPGTSQKKSPHTRLKFISVNIESDSHGRHLAGLIKELVDGRTKVSSVVKPGAKLLDVASNVPPPPGTCTVLIAGTNDLAAGEQTTVYRHLEQLVAARLTTSKVVVSTLPHRHDLPAHHPVNRQTELVNRHIKELTAKYDGTFVVDFNRIGRRLFTGHGMHLRMPGKRLLARLVLEGVAGLDVAAGTLRAATTSQSALPPTEPICLPYDNYAQAVKKASLHGVHTVEAKNASPDNVIFLGNVTRK